MTNNNLTVKDNTSITFRNKALASNSTLTYTDAVKQFHKYIKQTSQTEGAESIKAWLKLIREEKSPATFSIRAQALKDYLCERYKSDYRQLFGIHELFKNIRKPILDKAVLTDDYLTYEQVTTLFAQLTDKMTLIAQALFWTGTRISELINMKLTDVTIDDQKTIIKIKSGKGDKERTVYLPLNVYKKTLKTFNGNIYLFETKGGKQYNRVNVHKELKRQAKKAGFDIHPHTLRHSKAMYLKEERNLSPDMVAKALGHSDVATTLRFYYHGTPSAEEQGIF